MAKSFGEQFEDALKKGETNKVNWLINFLKDDDKKMALMKASKGGHLEVVKRFIEMGFDINQKDDKGNTALDYAFSSNKVELVEMMLDEGAKIDLCNTGEDFILAWGTYVGSLKVVDKFIEEKTKPGVWHKCNLEVKDASDVTLLMVAIQKDYVDIAKTLINSGADVNAKDDWGRTPLMYASEKGNLEIVEELVEFDALVNEKDELGRSALMRAVFMGDLEIAEQLIDAGADVVAKDIQGVSVLEFARDEKIRKAIFDMVKKKYEKEPEQNPFKGVEL